MKFNFIIFGFYKSAKYLASRKTKYYKKAFGLSVGIIVFLSLIYVYQTYRGKSSSNAKTTEKVTAADIPAVERTFINYADEVSKAAALHEIPYEYLMALITLECSGFKPCNSRFEKHVYKRLKEVKTGDLRKYENVKAKHLNDATDDALKNLASSWGAFQLMGYKCIGMEVNVSDIRGEEAVKYGVQWIKEEYGRYLKKEKFKDAFHYHNTGRKFPVNGKSRTHDPTYVDRGLKYIEYFKKHKP